MIIYPYDIMLCHLITVSYEYDHLIHIYDPSIIIRYFGIVGSHDLRFKFI
jgi:hypothetical protein